MTADERLSLIRVKIERAKKHIRDLETEIIGFKAGDPYVVRTKPDQQFPNTNVYYLAEMTDVPEGILAITGDALFNLRAALDHLAFQLALANGTTDEGVLTKTYFPIVNTDDPLAYETARAGKVKGMSQVAKDRIDAAKPYKGGNDLLWQLHMLNIFDKHRVVMTAVADLSGVSIDSRVRRQMMKALAASVGQNISDAEAEVKSKSLFIKPEMPRCPLKVGDILSWDAFNREVDNEPQFTFEIAFYEPPIIECEPILPTLIQMVNYVQGLVISFRPLLA